MTIRELMPRPTERQMIVGASGSGKTTLARAILQQCRAPLIVVIDPKCTYGGKGGELGYDMCRTPRQLRGYLGKSRRIQYRPSIDHQNVSGYDEVYEACYRKGNLWVYTDETFLTMRGTRAPDWQRNCITCGRELGVTMMFATQRPRGIDPRVLTEAESYAAFDLRKTEDRKTVADGMGDEAMARPPKFAFWYIRDGMRRPRLARLELGGS